MQRISWLATTGSPHIPWYAHEVPIVFVSVNCPFHQAEAHQIKAILQADAFCSMLDTRICSVSPVSFGVL